MTNGWGTVVSGVAFMVNCWGVDIRSMGSCFYPRRLPAPAQSNKNAESVVGGFLDYEIVLWGHEPGRDALPRVQAVGRAYSRAVIWLFPGTAREYARSTHFM